MPGYIPPAPKVVLEGDYSDWTSYDTQTDTGVGTPGTYDVFAVFNRLETVALFHHDNFVKKYDVAGKSLGSSLFTPYYSTGLEAGEQQTIRSAYGTYMVVIDDAADTFYVLKNGAIAKTITASDLGASAIIGVSISPTGEYIVVTVTNKWIILKGS